MLPMLAAADPALLQFGICALIATASGFAAIGLWIGRFAAR